MVLFAFSLTRKRSTPSGRNGFVLPLRSPADLIPCPYVPRIANEPSTRPITVHCETSKTLSNNHLRVPPSHVTPHSLPPRRSSPSAFLTKPFGIMESLAEGRIVPLNSRPCIFIFRCRMVEKKQEESPACEFFIFLYGSQHFYWKIFVSR